ncbi:hypothetical protein [Pedobacter panaciterrae]
MENLKINAVIAGLLMLLLSFTACEKDKNSEAKDTGIDLKNYSIVGKFEHKVNDKTLQVPYLIAFSENAKVIFYTINDNDQGNYILENGMVKCDFGGGLIYKFNIDKESITAYTKENTTQNLLSHILLKNPTQNQFNGASFNGSLANTGGNLLTVTKLKFNASQYGESSLGDPVINKDYTLINNMAATSNTRCKWHTHVFCNHKW